MLKEILITILKESDFVRLIVDGVDEVQSTEHRRVLQELHAITIAAGASCKLLVSSQDLPSIRPSLSGRTRDHLFLGDEKQAICKDMALVVDASLENLGDVLGVSLDMSERMSLRDRVLEKAEGRDLIPLIILSIIHLTNALTFRHVSMAETSPKSPRNSGEFGGAEVYCRQSTTRSGRDVSSPLPNFSPLGPMSCHGANEPRLLGTASFLKGFITTALHLEAIQKSAVSLDGFYSHRISRPSGNETFCWDQASMKGRLCSREALSRSLTLLTYASR